MGSSNIKFRLTAYTSEAARENNEDTLFVDDDLSDDILGQFTHNKVVDMNDNGIILVVADGMGGMNAGEVASDIATDTVRDCFEKEKIAEVVKSPAKIRKHIHDTIVLADANIKEEGRKDPAKAGMGSTIVLVWIVNGVAYVGWCGDSRAYCFNKANGLVRLSHDHSYVQELVDAGKIEEEVAMYHPDSNIITRSLGDPRKTAKPDIKEFSVHQGDIFLLCSDGLCGVLHDREIESIMRNDYEELSDMRKALWIAAEAAGWHDNVTTILCEIVSGGEEPVVKSCDEAEQNKKGFFNSKKTITLFSIIAALVIVIGCLFAWIFKSNLEHKDKDAFYQCKEVNDFRNYVRNYPNGAYIVKAKDTIAWFVSDSTKKAFKSIPQPEVDVIPNPEEVVEKNDLTRIDINDGGNQGKINLNQIQSPIPEDIHEIPNPDVDSTKNKTNSDNVETVATEENVTGTNAQPDTIQPVNPD